MEEKEIIHDQLSSLTVDPIGDAEKLYPKLFGRPKPRVLGQRQAKRLKQDYKREKKRVIKSLKDSSLGIKPIRLDQEAMAYAKELTMSNIERKLNGNTTNS